ncbi:MAG TPA: secondary thiamine-phosphate synthase enzyme YjbQ [Xanthobacteraceae bacterium]|jgi:secondary thiamine-phosphate synthase enzyme
MRAELSGISSAALEIVASATLAVETQGKGFTEITDHAARFLAEAEAQDGSLLLFIRHTSASLVIQENADPDVRTDLAASLARVAPEDAGWVHGVEGPDDMPAHVKTMLTDVCLHVPVRAGGMALGTWQGIYLAEHRTRPHRREVVLQFIGSRRATAGQPRARTDRVPKSRGE